ncbi:MAG: GtrA family protein [Burkholderiales bacterium]|nr:GtrA family protein [Burkholderiales bacterium]
MTAEPAASTARRESRQILRFVIAGAVNTGLSVLVYQAALFVMPHGPAYVLAYLAGIAIAYMLYSRQVFDAPLGTKRFAAFVVFYLASLALGTVLNGVLIEGFGIIERLAIFITVALMLPLNYLGSRFCLRAVPQ